MHTIVLLFLLLVLLSKLLATQKAKSDEGMLGKDKGLACCKRGCQSSLQC